MDIVDLSATVAMLLTLSLATERIVAIVKTAFPGWFAHEQQTDAGTVDRIADRWRRLRVQGVAFLGAWITAGALADGGNFNLLGVVDLGTVTVPALMVALLASSGSAFWAQVLGYTSAIKDIANRQKGVIGSGAAATADGGQVAVGKETRVVGVGVPG